MDLVVILLDVLNERVEWWGLLLPSFPGHVHLIFSFTTCCSTCFSAWLNLFWSWGGRQASADVSPAKANTDYSRDEEQMSIGIPMQLKSSMSSLAMFQEWPNNPFKGDANEGEWDEGFPWGVSGSAVPRKQEAGNLWFEFMLTFFYFVHLFPAVFQSDILFLFSLKASLPLVRMCLWFGVDQVGSLIALPCQSQGWSMCTWGPSSSLWACWSPAAQQPCAPLVAKMAGTSALLLSPPYCWPCVSLAGATYLLSRFGPRVVGLVVEFCCWVRGRQASKRLI